MPVVLQCLGLNLDRVDLDPVIEVGAHGDRAAVDVPAMVRFHAGLVPGSLCRLLGGESAYPSGLADAGLWVLDPNHVRPGLSTLHNAIAEPGGVLARSLGAGGLIRGCGGDEVRHYAAVLSARSLEM